MAESPAPLAAPAGRTSRTAWTMWAIGMLAYVVAVFNRSSLGVAGLIAQRRFSASASELSLFSVLQLGVYAGMQVPVGVLLDRLGSRRVIAAGAVLMAAGQLVLALATTVPVAIVARVLVGAGDAMTFVCVLRLVTLWFDTRHVPVITQLTGILGQLGQIAATYPLVYALHGPGWEPSYGAASAGGLLVGLVVFATLRDAPPGLALDGGAPPDRSLGRVREDLGSSWREAGTRIGLWTHFVTQFSGTVFALLWGYPFLVAGEGLSPGEASALLTLMVASGMFVAPVVGRLVAGWPLRRSVLVYGIVAVTAAAWTAVLAWPGRAPLGLLVMLVLVLSTNGPGSMIGFDYARTFNPAVRLGGASGIVNVGGFIASLSTILLIGVILDLNGAGTAATYNLNAFRWALSVQYVFWVVGVAGVTRNRTLLRQRLSDEGVQLDPVARAFVRRVNQARRGDGPSWRG